MQRWVVLGMMLGLVTVGQAADVAVQHPRIPGPVLACDNATASGAVRCRWVPQGQWYDVVDIPPPLPTEDAKESPAEAAPE